MQKYCFFNYIKQTTAAQPRRGDTLLTVDAIYGGQK